MGKRKSRTKPVPKKRMDKLDTVFSCPFCGCPKSVDCTIDRKNKIGTLTCSICQECYSTTAHHLTEEIDIYSEWIDACEQVNELLTTGTAVGPVSSSWLMLLDILVGDDTLICDWLFT